jgi:uncharacterized protein (DUF1810 family)
MDQLFYPRTRAARHELRSISRGKSALSLSLGFSAKAQRFAIGSRGEAVAYLAHEISGPRLIECTRLVMAASERTIDDIPGHPMT